MSEYLHEIFSSSNKQCNIVSALIIANTIFERFANRFSHLFSEVVDKILKKFYGSMKSKFLRERMTYSSLSIFQELLNLKIEAINIFEDWRREIFMQDALLKNIEIKDFENYENIISIYSGNLKILFDNNIIVVNEQKLEATIAEKYMGYLESIQTYDYQPEYSKIKLVENYLKVLTVKALQEINGQFGSENWEALEIDYHSGDTLAYILNAKYLEANANILNESNLNAGAKTEEPDYQILNYKNEIHINNMKFIISKSYVKVLSFIRDLLFLFSSFANEEPAFGTLFFKRIVETMIVGCL